MTIILNNQVFAQSSKVKQEVPKVKQESKKCTGNAYDGINLKLFEFKSGPIDKAVLTAMDDCLSIGYKIHPFQIFRTNDSSVYVLLEKIMK